MFEFEAFAVLKTKEFTTVNECFQDKSNDEIGNYAQTLIGNDSIKACCIRGK